MYNIETRITKSNQVICEVRTSENEGLYGMADNFELALERLRGVLESRGLISKKGFVTLKTVYDSDMYGVGRRHILVRTQNPVSQISVGTYLRRNQHTLVVTSFPQRVIDKTRQVWQEFEVMIRTDKIEDFLTKRYIEKEWAIIS